MSLADIIRVIIMIIFTIVSFTLTIIVLMQEGKSAGLSGAINGIADSYWGKNKGRSYEGKLVLVTKILAIGFLLMAIILNINF